MERPVGSASKYLDSLLVRACMQEPIEAQITFLEKYGSHSSPRKDNANVLDYLESECRGDGALPQSVNVRDVEY